ncbi:MAG: hypothetical protein CVV27_12875 [Candidatus Melainabacteria bacterium HGW-Melainabacteria-1]|nr:MAG: hypothetical protein CVV27_12875 [Candidatus Melainabacteria bacterium HGW-Melainabacteria-1]
MSPDMNTHQPHPLANRRLVLCQQHPPTHCVHCEQIMPAKTDQRLMMINAIGEAVVCPGPVQLCAGCDAVYVHETYYSGIAAEFGFDPYTLVGFIDLELLPESQRDQPIGEDPTVPIPLLEFTAVQLLQQAKFT